MRKKPLQTLAGSVRVCYHFCRWRHRLTGHYEIHTTSVCLWCIHTMIINHISAGGVINDLTDIFCTAQRACNTSSLKCPLSFDQSLCWWRGQRIVSLHSRLCSEAGESCRLVEALVVCGRHFGRRMEGDKLRAPQLWRWRSSCIGFLGLPNTRWVIICTTKTKAKHEIEIHPATSFCYLYIIVWLHLAGKNGMNNILDNGLLDKKKIYFLKNVLNGEDLTLQVEQVWPTGCSLIPSFFPSINRPSTTVCIL